ncbi:zinc finger protein 260 [Agrilus planipennis]|uniref:Zinc finger protein 260 n=1 Tax=Agrilus planipennis TaxID=224129 RepID=A0A1W4XEC6_AGRPL|nr:zinc finger protein 260 [Agrilus planipennis]
MEKICRSCMIDNVNMKNIFEDQENLQIIDMFFMCTSIKISENDGLPPYLCSDCQAKLKISFNFKKQSEKSDSLLRARFKDELQKVVSDLNHENSTKGLNIGQNGNKEINPSALNTEQNKCNEGDGTFINDKEIEQVHIKQELSDLNELEEVKGEVSDNDDVTPGGDTEEEIIKSEDDYKKERSTKTMDLLVQFLPSAINTEKLGTKFQCPDCKKSFVKEGNFLRHIKNHKSLEILYNKLVAEKTATTPAKSESSNSQSNEGSVVLLQTEENSSTEEEVSLDDILPTTSNEKTEKKTKCPACKKTFVKRGSFLKHLWTHEDLDMSVPEIEKYLNKKPSKPQQKRRHLCKECGKSFSRKDFLSFHKKSAHNKGKPVTKRHLCVYCGKSFDYASNFLIHVRRHTGDLPYKCKECKKAFPRYHDLKCHERQHSGEKPYLCSFCGKSFGLQYKLTRHLRVHTGEKPYKCDVCMSSFAQSNDLVNHAKRTHSYACIDCPARFVMRISLEKHCESSGHLLDSKYKSHKTSTKKESIKKDTNNSDNNTKK